MTPLKEFQVRFGRDWETITSSPAFAAALTLANAEKNETILGLTDEAIVSNGAAILADLRGHMRYENALLGLHEKKEFVFGDIGEETYPDPIIEAEEEAAAQDIDEQVAQSNASIIHNAPSKQLSNKKKTGKPKHRKSQ